MTYSSLKKREGNWAELTVEKTPGTVTRDREKISQWLAGKSPVIIPETIAGRISAPVLFSFLKRRLGWSHDFVHRLTTLK